MDFSALRDTLLCGYQVGKERWRGECVEKKDRMEKQVERSIGLGTKALRLILKLRMEVDFVAFLETFI